MRSSRLRTSIPPLGAMWAGCGSLRDNYVRNAPREKDYGVISNTTPPP